ncbi:hypothetical protein FF1_027896 [Malus domestica]
MDESDTYKLDKAEVHRNANPNTEMFLVGTSRKIEHKMILKVIVGRPASWSAMQFLFKHEGETENQPFQMGLGCSYQGEGVIIREIMENSEPIQPTMGRRPEKKLKDGSSSNASGAGNRSCFVGMPILEKWSMVEKAIMSEDELQDVPVIEDDNIWDYLDGAAKVEMEALNVRRAGKQPWGGGGWPTSAAKLP